MKYSNTAITQLTRWYKQILIKCAIINAAILAGATLIATPAMAQVAIDTSALTVTVSALDTATSVSGTATISGLGTMATENAADYQTKLDAGQLAAVNSGITTAGVTQINTNKTDIATINTTLGTYGDIVTHDADEFQAALSTDQLAAVNSGITAAKVTSYDNAVTNLGDVTAFTGSTTGNISNSVPGSGTNANNASSAIANIDATIGQIHGLASTITDAQGAQNLEQGSTVSGHLVALAGAIGDRSGYSEENYIAAAQTVSASLDALDVALGDVEDVVDNHTASLNSIAQLVDGGSVAATGVYTPGEALTAYDGASTITGVINKLETNKQEALDITATSGLQWLDSPTNTQLAVKLKENSGLAVSSDGLAVDLGDSMQFSTTGKVDIKANTSEFEITTTNGLNLKDLGVTEGKIANGAVTTDKLGAGAVTEAKLGDLAVTTGKIADSAVTSAKLADNAVTTAKIEDGAVTNDKLALLSVDTGNIIDSAVTSAKLADNAVTTAKIEDSAVTEDKIADGAVTHAKIGDGAVDTNNLADGAVETDKIADEAVTFAKLNTAAYDTTGAAVAAGSANVLATGATVKLGAENADYTGTKVTGFTDSTTIKSALSETTAALNNILTADGTMVDDAKVYVRWNNDDSDLATVLGTGEYANHYNITLGDSITATFDALDEAIGDRSAIGSANTAINTATATSVAAGLKAAGDAIGDLQYAAPAAVSYGALTADTDLTTVAAQLAYNIGDAVTNTTNGVAADASVNANIDALNTKVGDISGVAVNGYDATAADATLVAGVNALNDNMEAVLGDIYKDDGTYDATVLVGNGFAEGSADLSDALTTYAADVQAALGTTFDDDGSYTNDFTRPAAVNYGGLADDATLVAAIAQLDANIGDEITGVDRSATLAAATTAADATVNANIDALDAAIGDLDYTGGAVNYALENGSATDGIKTLVATIGAETTAANGNIAAANSVNANLDMLDEAIGDRSAIGSANTAINTATATSVAAGLKAAGDKIGNMDFAGTNYVSGDEDLSSAVRTLDSNLYRLDTEVKDLRKDMNRGFASMAAMSAMVPNARATGNTQLSVGTGMYSGHVGFALGGFHWFTDNLMMNVGMAYGDGDKSDVIYRAGVTYSW